MGKETKAKAFRCEHEWVTPGINNEIEWGANQLCKHCYSVRLRGGKIIHTLTAQEKEEHEAQIAKEKQSRITQLREKATIRRDTSEKRALADVFLDVRRCKGAHLVMEGLCCMHCDSTDPSSVCMKEKVCSKNVADEYPDFEII